MAPAWIEHKACRPAYAGLFFPAPGSGEAVDYGPGLAICADCPVRAQCRADAEAHGDIAGGRTTHGQVVGGCAPPKAVAGERPRFQCVREGCVVWFLKRQGANMYCSVACASEARRANRAESYRRRRVAS